MDDKKDKIKKLDDYKLYNEYFTLKKQMQIDAERDIDGFGSDIKIRLFNASEHYFNVVSLINIEREMIACGLTP